MGGNGARGGLTRGKAETEIADPSRFLPLVLPCNSA